ncbi:MAG: RNA polymerase sigma factor [Pseudomonadota bacterium]
MPAQVFDPSLKAFIDEQERLVAIALRIVESHAVAEEVVQESWLRWQRHSYAAEDAAPLFTSIVRNLAHDWRRARHREVQSIPDLEALRGDTPCSERAVIARDELKRVVAALRKLPPRTLRAFSLRFVDGLTYEQVGQRIGLSLSRSRTLIENAMLEISIALA